MDDNNNSDLIIFLLAAVVGICIWIFTKYKNEQKQRDNLIKENIKLLDKIKFLEAEHLKFQLQPHTLNNILSNLKVIAGNLNKGMDCLSEILDYIVYKGDAHFVSVEDELNFIKQYLDLNDLFISEIDSIMVDQTQLNQKSKYFTSPCLPHLITAYFIENAFKHGDVNNPKFLKIQLKLSDSTFEMTVVNKIKQKPNKSKGGLGLSNMRKRLELLLTGKYKINSSFNEDEYQSMLTINF